MNITQEGFEYKKYLEQLEEKNKQDRGDVAPENGEEPQNTIAEGRRGDEKRWEYFINSSLSQ